MKLQQCSTALSVLERRRGILPPPLSGSPTAGHAGVTRVKMFKIVGYSDISDFLFSWVYRYFFDVESII